MFLRKGAFTVLYACVHIVARSINVLFHLHSFLRPLPISLKLPTTPHCVGALDGKHYVIQGPNNSYCAPCSAKYRLIYIDVGCNGRLSDGGVFSRSTLGQAFLSNLIELPELKRLPGRNTDMPYYLVADDAFPLSTYLKKPYLYRDLPTDKRIFNYRVSRARNTVENVVGIIPQRYRMLRKPMLLQPSTAEKVALALCYEQGSGIYTRDLLTGIPTTVWFSLQRRGVPPPPSQREVREELTNYFMSPEREVRWQYRH
ncbi:hypothetical protein PR048_009397, partial [Dryococelus australis]